MTWSKVQRLDSCSVFTQTNIIISKISTKQQVFVQWAVRLKKRLVLVLEKGENETPHLYCAPERAHSCFILEIIAVKGIMHNLGIMSSQVFVSFVAMHRTDDSACYYLGLERSCLISAKG